LLFNSAAKIQNLILLQQNNLLCTQNYCVHEKFFKKNLPSNLIHTQLLTFKNLMQRKLFFKKILSVLNKVVSLHRKIKRNNNYKH